MSESENKHKNQILSDSEVELLNAEPYRKLQTLFGGKFNNFLKEHIDNSKKAISEIESLIGQEDAPVLERQAHSLKGATAQFGAKKLSALAFEMEKAGKESDFEKAKALLSELRQIQEKTAALMFSLTDA